MAFSIVRGSIMPVHGLMGLGRSAAVWLLFGGGILWWSFKRARETGAFARMEG